MSRERRQIIKHRGSCPERLTLFNYREMAFAELWEKENRRWPGINSGLGVLEIIMQDKNNYPHNNYGVFKPITKRDAFVAATVIQWLGTNCGQGFLEEVQRKIEENKIAYDVSQRISK